MLHASVGVRRLTGAILVLAAVAFPAFTSAAEPLDFENQIWPLLHERCHACHGPKVQESGLRLDVRAEAIGDDAGSAIVPGRSEASELIRRIASPDPDVRMPPQGRELSAEEISRLKHWIDAGAPWPESNNASTDPRSHWAWSRPRATSPPQATKPESAESPIDLFVQAPLAAEGRAPSPPADRRTLLRRAYFDLVGLPPTREETAAFLADDRPDALEAAVDRLLASPRHGERWGRHWMDLVRYADTAGDNADYPIPEAVLYRDYVIDYFNEDRPYDEFLVEQLAGDLLAEEGPADLYARRVVATGYLALSRRYATAPFELMHLTLEDAIDTTGRAFLGLTLRCARCHDHKFDPVTMEDYYGLYGVLAGTRFPYAGSEEFQSKRAPRSGFAPLVGRAEAAGRFAEHEREIERLRGEVERAERSLQEAGEEREAKARIESALKKLRRELARRERRGSPPDLPVAYAVTEGSPGDQAIHLRGEPDEPGPVAPRRAPRFLAGDAPLDIAEGRSGRIEFARWLAAPDNPLTAKVMANRVWQHHFGRGLVRTPSNFGVLGEPPTHPELLDWLAIEFIETGWSIKSLHRLILGSAAWRQASDPTGGEDPLVGRFPRRRIDAEAVRDSMLYLAGGLDLARPGPHPFPPIEKWNWTQHNPFKAVYPSPHRSVYLMRQRIQRHPFLALFDAPDANVSTDVRTTATAPQQALFLMNDPFVEEQAAGFADRLLAGGGGDDARRVEEAIESAWSRPARREEVERALRYLDRYGAEAERAGLAPQDARREAWTSYARVLMTTNEFFYLD